MKPNRLKNLLREGKYASGSWVSMCNPLGAEIMGMVGFDWLLVDMEHGAGDYQTLLSQLQAIAAAGDSTPIVRVEWNDPVVVKRVLDIGAEGVMVPGIKTAEEARKAIGSIKYPPQGFRGIAGVRASRFGQDPTYLKEANDNVVMFLQIETKESVANVEDILSVPGIDVVFVGPNDLAADLGHTGDMAHEEVQGAIKKVEDVANAKGIVLGSVSRNWDQAKALIDKGYRAVSIMGDIPMLIQGAKGNLENFRNHPHVAGA
ncbi:MAG: aldolase/citrate lyase family protein [SAR324 cluster bacterium]|nr:aldolase/citrate lyase family protein [SAR324 cluster bacterium]MCZ6534110.1 aldolase/citrate lyase family protein [SAR324 cluster bacterium]MCZ6557718.1 aldolase/citrate lyase family protein [SAR324 cluster bacterium]MCZ6728229.1 aldolase/citrate lyase family protein [SAR324 cluster bacterium]